MSSLSLGTAQLGMAYGVANAAPAPRESAAMAMLARAEELGIRAIDTAPAYGAAERWIGSYLAQRESGATLDLGTKLPALGAIPTREVAARVDEHLGASLRRLGVERVRDYLIHDLSDLRRHGRALIDALGRSRDRGMLERIGVSVYSPDDLDVLADFPDLTVVQHPVSLLDQRLAERGMIERLASDGIEIHARSVLLQGLLAMEPARVPPTLSFGRDTLLELRRVLSAYGLTPLEAALPFVSSLGLPRIVIGSDSPAQLAELVGTADTRLPEALIETLRREFAGTPASLIDPRRWPT